MDPATLSLLSNPALLAISQDPLGLPVLRVWQKPATTQNNTYSTALYTADALSFWTGQLNGGDAVVAFVNAGPAAEDMSADMNDIFIDQITTGTNAPVRQLMMAWDVYDVWGYRIDNSTASSILRGNATSITPAINSTATLDAVNATTAGFSGGGGPAAARYNATVLPYADGVRMNITSVLGKKISVLSPGGKLEVRVPRHGVAVYRLRSRGMVAGMRRRDEL